MDFVLREELWLPIVGWEGLYEVSDLGRVRSLSRLAHERNGRKRFYPGRVLRQTASPYCQVSLCLAGKEVRRNVHRLVMAAFVGPCPEGMEVCHGLGGKTDNRLKNLSYGTKSQNHGADRLRDGTDIRGEKHGHARLTETNVHFIRASNAGSRALANMFGVGRTTIKHIKARTTWAWLPEAQP